jgi:hypothetical protein
VFGDADAVGSWCVNDENATRACGRDVDIVHACTGASDNFESTGAGEKVVVNLRRATDEQRIGVGESRNEIGLRASGLHVDGPSGFGTEQIQGGGGQAISDNDFHFEREEWRLSAEDAERKAREVSTCSR